MNSKFDDIGVGAEIELKTLIQYLSILHVLYYVPSPNYICTALTVSYAFTCIWRSFPVFRFVQMMILPRLTLTDLTSISNELT